MIRKLSLAVAVATALSPLGGFALGLGEIHSQSALNQKFKAEIDLLSVGQEEIQDLRVNLASDEAFDRAGIERLFLLTGLHFQPMYSASGKPVIRVTSVDPIREPFLNFLLEVNWPKGRLVREFTVLLDPPLTLNRAPQQMSAPSVSTTPPAPRTAASSRRQTTPMRSSVGSIGGREYGPVQPNENLWTIAKMMRNSNESIEQVMMALQRYNPDAFGDSNVNNLKVGKVLRLPEGADVTSLSHQAAREEFLAQTRVWRSSRGMVAAPSKVTKAPTPEDRLKLISSKPDTEGEAMSREGDADEVSRLEQEILLIRESNESALQENEALRDRVQELEKQIEDIQRLVTLKSDELAQMQQAQQIAGEKMEEMQPPAAEEAPAQVEAEPPIAEEAPTPVEVEPIAEPAVTAEEKPPVVPIPEGTVIEETDIEAVIEEAEKTDTEAPVAAPPETAPEPKPEIAEAPDKPEPVKPPVAPMTEKKISYFDNIKGNMTLVGIIGAVAVFLIGLMWMVMRRRKEAEAEFAESILVSPDSEITATGKDEADSLHEPSDETSFMSDFSPSDIDALQDETGEVDPLSEADVYIAYGRYQQAEELIKQAIEKFPDREELKQKLLEIYFSAKKSGEFTVLAEELHNSGLESRNPDAWGKVIAMGKELNSTHALFAGAAAATLVGGEGLEDLGIDLGDEFGETSKPVEPSPSEMETSDELDSMDLSGLDNLDEMDSENLAGDMSLDSEFLDKMESGEVTDKEDEALDIDLGELDLPSGGLEAMETTDQQAGVEAFDLGDSEALDNMNLESIERELEGLSEDLDSQISEPLELPTEEFSEEISLDLDSTDEVTTKLDLARAYIDMGDNEGAKSILEEVVGEGTDQQKQEAQELLNTMG
jgi:pilus assembly protein FimV